MDTLVVETHPIGQGGNGAVYKLIGYQPPAVIKYLINVNEQQVEEFKNEYEALDRLSHPHMINYIKSVENLSDPLRRFAIITEFCDRGSLDNFIKNPNILYTIRTVIAWSRGLFDALGNLFERLDFVHKDVKPGNVFITKDWTVKLGDFGSVRACDGTSIEAFRGTIRYSVPDQIGIPELGENPTEEEKELRKRCYHRNDVYSLGLVLWELIERRQVYSNYEKVDGYNGKMFNESLFYSFIQANKQFDLEPINCIEELKVIFENATKFLALERSDAMETRDQLAQLEKESWVNEFIEAPREDNEERDLVKPKGFDGTRHRVLVASLKLDDAVNEEDYIVPDPEMSDSSSDGETSAKKESKQPDPSLDDFLPKKFSKIDRSWLKKLYNLLNFSEKQEFCQEIRALYGEMMEKKRYFDELAREMPSPYSNHENLAPSLAIRKAFQEILDFKIICLQGLAMGDFFTILGKVDRGFFDPASHHRNYCKLIEKLESKKRDLFPSARIFFKCYTSTINQKEWLFLKEYPEINRYSFVSKNLNEIFPFYGIWSNDRRTLTLKNGHEEEKLVRNLSTNENPGDLLYSHDEPIDFFMIIDAMREKSAQILRTQKLKLAKMLPLDEVNKPKFELPKKIGQNLPIAGYCFQLRNQPRVHFDKELKCPIVSLGHVQYYDWSPKAAKIYLKSYLSLCKDFERMENFNHIFYNWTNTNPMITKRTMAYKFQKTKQFKEHYFVFLQCPNFLNKNGKNLILLDHPNNYQKGEKVQFFDYDLCFYEVESAFLMAHLEKYSKSLSYFLMAPIEDCVMEYKLIDRHGKEFSDEYLDQIDMRVMKKNEKERKKKKHKHRSKAEKATLLFY